MWTGVHDSGSPSNPPLSISSQRSTSTWTIPHPSTRPFVVGIGSINEWACMYVDFFLQPRVLKLPSYLCDSTSAMQAFEGVRVPMDTLLVTCDVKSLYSNITHNLGMPFLGYNHFLHDSTIIDVLNFVLLHNYFIFDVTFYCQISGMAMGACCAPT